MILVIDNYDSFVHNLARYFKVLGKETQVVRHDAITINEIEQIAPDAIVLSPGPCTPDEAGICLSVVKYFKKQLPILGVCLGHQTIAQAFGAKILPAQKPMHGRISNIEHDDSCLFKGLVNPLEVARYHSLIVSENDFPHEQLHITARSEQSEIMAIAHREYPIFGVQFHPESILTNSGYEIIKRFCGVVLDGIG